MKDANEQMNENIERGERQQEQYRRDMNRTHFYEKEDKPNYKVKMGGGRGNKVSHFRFFAGIVVWLFVAYVGFTYFFNSADIFGILGFSLMILIIYFDWWYPKFRRWRRGY